MLDLDRCEIRCRVWDVLRNPQEGATQDVRSPSCFVADSFQNRHTREKMGMPYMRQSSLRKAGSFVSWNSERQQSGHYKTRSSQQDDRLGMFLGKSKRGPSMGDFKFSLRQRSQCGFRKKIRHQSISGVAYQKRKTLESSQEAFLKRLTLKLGELLGTRTEWCRRQSAAKPGNRNVQRLSRKGVEPSGSKCLAPKWRRYSLDCIEICSSESDAKNNELGVNVPMDSEQPRRLLLLSQPQ